MLETSGDFGGTAKRSTGQVPGFIPRTGNVSLVWRYGAVSARVSANYVGSYITNYTAPDSPRNLYRFSRTITNIGAAYHYRPWLNFTVDVSNLFNETESFYRGYRDRMSSTNIPGTTITMGVNGRF